MATRHPHAGFTLIEVLVSTAIATILFAAIGSCIMIASRAYPSPGSPLAQAISGAQAIDLISADLRFAKSVTSGNSKSLIFTIPDRTGDGKDEVIAYVWSGSAGDPLLRYFNSDVTDVVATPVQILSLAYDTRTISGTTTRTVLDRVTIDLAVGTKATCRPMRSCVIVLSAPEVP